MLNCISGIITPDVFRVIYEMGHLDELAIVDANFSAQRLSPTEYVFLPIHDNNLFLAEMLKYFPLDSDEPDPVCVFQPDYSETEEPNCWKDYQETIDCRGGKFGLRKLEREDFYRRARNAYGAIRTLDQRVYANLLVRKGFVLNVEDTLRAGSV